MNICLVSLEYPPDSAKGGIGTQTWNKAHALAALGHKVHVVSRAANKASARIERDGSLSVHRIEPADSEFPLYETIAYWLSHSCRVARYLHQLQQSEKLDLIDFAEYGAEGAVFQLNRTVWNWVPIVVQLHGPLAIFTEHVGWPEPHSELHQVGATLEGASIRSADALMACSTNIATFTSRYYGLPLQAIDVVHCGVDTEGFFPGKPAEDPTVLFVGNLAVSKGIETVADAVLRLRPKHPRLRLSVIGKGNTSLVDRLRRRAEAQGAADALDFVGFVDQRSRMPDYYRAATVFCSPAQHEAGVANVYIEAMACGCPVIAATTGGAPEAVTDGETGLLVPPGDVDALVAALDRILGNREAASRMGAAGRRRVEDYFAMDRYIGRVLATYNRAIETAARKLQTLKSAQTINITQPT